MVGLWPCKVSSEVHINGRCVSELVQEDTDKATVPESKDEKDPKRTPRVLSKGHEVVGLGYSRLSGDAARVVDIGAESGNPNWVDRVHREYDKDRQTDRVTQDSWGNRDSNLKSENSSRVNRVGNTEQKTRGSNWVVNTESRVAENSANTERRVADNSANMENRAMKNSVNMENLVM
jgi:hypothetical protein